MKKIIAIVLVLVLSLSLVACGAGSGKTIKIGILSPTTEGAVHGVPVKQAAEMAVEEINAAGGIDGKQIELIHYDTKGDPTEGVNAYKRLRDKDEIVALLGGTYSGVTKGIKPEAIADNMPMLSPTATADDVTIDAPNLFRACYSDSYQGVVCANFAVNSMNATVPGVLYCKDDAYSDGLAKNFMSACEGLGLDYVAEAYGKDDKDFSAPLGKLAEAGVDVLFLPHYTDFVGPILKQISDNGYEMKCLGPDGWDGITNDYADVCEGFFLSNHYAADSTEPVVVDFVSSYEEKYGETPNALAALSYDAAYVMAAAIERAGSTDADAIIAALPATDHPGVTGQIKFDGNGDTIKSVAMIEIKDGNFVFHSMASPE